MACEPSELSGHQVACVGPWPFWLKRFACVNVVSRPADSAMISGARRAASRARYAWKRKQPQQSCCTGGIERGSQTDVHEEAIIELARVQALLECRLESMDFLVLAMNSVQDLWKTFHLAPNVQCLNSMRVGLFGGSLIDDAFVSDLPKVVLPFLDDDIEPSAVTRDEPAPVIEYMTHAVKEFVSPAVTYTAPSPVTEYVASTPAGLFDKLFPVDGLATF